jgi:hypothetical protein
LIGTEKHRRKVIAEDYSINKLKIKIKIKNI